MNREHDNGPNTTAVGLYRPWAVAVLRVVIGATFIISGFSKAIDPWGFIFKIEDYLGAWDMSQPRTLVFVAAVGLSAAEFVPGILLLSGGLKKAAPRLLTLLMVFLLPLTLYTWIANPVSDCGCFGEMLHLSNAATFWKNVILMASLIYLCKYNYRLNKGIFRPAIQWILCIVASLYILFISLYGYNVQPMIDFRDYKEGTDLHDMLTDAESDDDTSRMVFIYEKDGKRENFSIDNLPDSTWMFVDRYEEGSSVPNDQVSALTVYDGDEDITSNVIAGEGKQLLLVIPESNRIDISYTPLINDFNNKITDEGGEMTGLISATPEGIEEWIDLSMATYPCYSVEDTSLKQLARGTMSFVYLEDGVIRWKRTLSSIAPSRAKKIMKGENGFDSLAIDNHSLLLKLTAGALAILLATALFQELAVRLFRKKRINEKKA